MFGAEYASIFPKIKRWSSSLMLEKEKIESLLRMNFKELIAFVTTLGKKISFSTENTAELEGLLKQEGFYFLESVSLFLSGSSKAFVKIWAKMYEIENIKIITRCLVNKRPISTLYEIGGRSRIQLSFVKNIKSLDDFLDFLSGTEYYNLAFNSFPAIKENGETFHFEMDLDNFYLMKLKAAMSKMGNKEKKEINETFLFYLNLLRLVWIYRARFNYQLSVEETISILPNIIGIIPDKQYRGIIESETGEVFIQKIRNFNFFNKIKGVIDGKSLERNVFYILLMKVRKLITGLPFRLSAFLSFYILHIISIRNIITLIEGKRNNYSEAKLRDLLIMR